MVTEAMTTERQVKILSTMTNRDEAGRHFAERYDDETLAALEQEGLIEIRRPVHNRTGMDYDRQYWTLEVTPEGVDLVQVNPEFWDAP